MCYVFYSFPSIEKVKEEKDNLVRMIAKKIMVWWLHVMGCIHSMNDHWIIGLAHDLRSLFTIPRPAVMKIPWEHTVFSATRSHVGTQLAWFNMITCFCSTPKIIMYRNSICVAPCCFGCLLFIPLMRKCEAKCDWYNRIYFLFRNKEHIKWIGFYNKGWVVFAV